MISRRFSGMFSRRKENEAKKHGIRASPATTLQRQASLNNQALLRDEFATMGVSLAYLRSLDIPEEEGFQAVRDKIVEMTHSTRGHRSLASYLLQDPKTKDLVGKADCFVSYAWNGGFGATMRALSKHFADKHDVYVWMDVAMVDQHAATNTDVDFDAWSRTFKESLKQIGKAVLVLTPAQNPIAITRSWCCFEWASMKQADIPFEYCVTPEDVAGLIERMERGMGIADFNTLFAGINVEKATAFKDSDSQAILKLMREIGVKEVNDIIMFSLKNWLLRVAEEAKKRVQPGTREGVYLLNAKAALHDALGEFDAALPLYQLALSEARKVSDFNTGIATQLNNLAQLLSSKGDYLEAEKLVRDACLIDEKALGSDHADYATDLVTLSQQLSAQGKYDEAIAEVEKALTIYRKSLGNDHPFVATTRSNLAQLLGLKGDYDGAIPLQEEAIVIWKKALGNDHPQVATGLNNLAGLLHAKRDYDGAISLFREAVTVWKKALGDDHPNVASGLNNLAELYSSKGDYSDAEPLYREAILVWKQAMGNDHPLVATGLNNLAELLSSKGDYSGAEPLHREALAIRKKALGDAHPDVALSLNDLAGLLESKGDYSGAEPLYRESLAIRKKGLGVDHPAVATALNNLARLLRKTGRLQDAKTLCEESLAIRQRCFGDDNVETAISLSELACVCLSLGMMSKAEASRLHDRAIGIVSEKNGRDGFYTKREEKEWIECLTRL